MRYAVLKCCRFRLFPHSVCSHISICDVMYFINVKISIVNDFYVSYGRIFCFFCNSSAFFMEFLNICSLTLSNSHSRRPLDFVCLGMCWKFPIVPLEEAWYATAKLVSNLIFEPRLIKSLQSAEKPTARCEEYFVYFVEANLCDNTRESKR